MSAAHHLAQINIARVLYPLDDERMRGFVEQLDHVNALAERAAGFVWRLKAPDGQPTSYLGNTKTGTLIINMSVWDSLAALREFTYSGDHLRVFRERAQWFQPLSTPHLVLWWVPAGHIPPFAEARDRLAHLRRHGPTAAAFTFAAPFPPPGV